MYHKNISGFFHHSITHCRMSTMLLSLFFLPCSVLFAISPPVGYRLVQQLPREGLIYVRVWQSWTNIVTA